MLFAMGDGNHSLATAKSIWERGKAEFGMDHPARYALVEVENIHDPGLKFEAIHRVLFGVQGDLAAALDAYFGERCRLIPCASEAEMDGRESTISAAPSISSASSAPMGSPSSRSLPADNLPVGTLQNFLDDWAQRGGYARLITSTARMSPPAWARNRATWASTCRSSRRTASSRR